MGKTRGNGEGAAASKPVRTTLVLPRPLWLRAKQQALLEGKDLKDLLLEGLELRLRRKETAQ